MAADHKHVGLLYTLGLCSLLAPQPPAVLSQPGPGHQTASGDRSHVPCYDELGLPQHCLPPFFNAAFQLPVEATNTCGTRGPEEFCQQTGISGATKSCDVCDAGEERKSHPPRYLTDFPSAETLSWWQSGTMLSKVQWPNSVNLTLRLGKAFEITYVRLKFHSSRPESFAILKRTTKTSPLEPYQFYSASCQLTYGLPVAAIIQRSNEAQALCTADYSDISPLTGGSVAFSTLEGRPSAYQFETSPVLQEWVTATDIVIVLNRINTFRDEVFGDPNVLRSYYYAISDFAVGGRCKCNGHASECVRQGGRPSEPLVCRCEHNTTGADCNECLPFYNDRAWRRSSQSDAFECLPCNCSGLSSRCYYDDELFRRTGHGGHCTDCRDNTVGPNCELCAENYYKRGAADRCLACNCHLLGARRQQCESSGTCECKPGVAGEKCDRCMPNHFDFGFTGCKPCQCHVAGSANTRPDCAASTGACRCKEYVHGQNCDACKPGYFGLSESDPLGCMPCFCYGHSSTCSASPGYTTRVVHSDFDSGVQKWRGETRGGQDIPLQFNAQTGSIGVSAPSVEAVYFVAPDRYLGDHRYSYNLLLSFSLRIGEERALASPHDVTIEGAGGLRVSATIFAQSNALPRTVAQEYTFRLNEHPSNQWTPRLTATEFIRLLSNVTALKIRGTYTLRGVGFIDNVKLQSAREGSGGAPANNVERCVCPEGYVGQFCESCAPGYRRDPLTGGALDRCVPCNCNKHSDACDSVTGRCICQHNTVGASCERCAPGYYGYALAGTPHDCKPCPCPDNGQCVQLISGDVACVGCKEGYTGNRCNLCLDGYYGDPEGKGGRSTPCVKCSCNDNIDTNAVGNCDRLTGECLKCVYNTAGVSCERCLLHHYGNALTLPKGQCKPCNCHKAGTGPGRGGEQCDVTTGQCHCRPLVMGKQCDRCVEGHWNIASGTGCERCSCDVTGSLNASCDIRSGECHCKPGVNARQCNSCANGFYAFSATGCTACNCSPEGSLSAKCDQRTGACQCRVNIGGRQCDQCAENKYNLAAGCIDCPVCYNLVQEQINILRRKIVELRLIIKNINENPGAIDDAEFRRKMKIVNDTVVQLLKDARRYSGGGGISGDQLDAISNAITDISISLNVITENIIEGSRDVYGAGVDTAAAERAVDEADRVLGSLELLIEGEGKEALREAREARDRLGQQSDRMTAIATEARVVSLGQESQSVRIEMTSQAALNTSQEALRIAEAALLKPGGVATDLVKLRRDINDASRLYDQTKALAESSQQKARDAYQESLSLYSSISGVSVPRSNISAIRTEINNIENNTNRVKTEADSLIEDHQSLMDNIGRQKQEAQRLLETGHIEQSKTDELLAQAFSARAMAREAVAKAENLLMQANRTLYILREFDQTVKQSKAGAEDALKKIPVIEKNIAEAVKKTSDARDNLADAESDAIAAKETAEQALVLAERALKEVKSLYEETLVVRRESTQLSSEYVRLLADVDKVEERLRRLEQQAEDDAKLAREALEKAARAKTSAISSSNKVSTALKTVKDIQDQLGVLDPIDMNMLNQLERNLANAERALTTANIDARYAELSRVHEETNVWVQDYTAELAALTLDVANIRHINETIPRTCFRASELEPTDPTVG